VVSVFSVVDPFCVRAWDAVAALWAATPLRRPAGSLAVFRIFQCSHRARSRKALESFPCGKTTYSGNGPSSMPHTAKTLPVERDLHDKTVSFVHGRLSMVARSSLFRTSRAWYDTSRGSVLGGRGACRNKDGTIGCTEAAFARFASGRPTRRRSVIPVVRRVRSPTSWYPNLLDCRHHQRAQLGT
jgi:hypothetical protein